ncbi:hypothetical protein [Streptomyces sp. NPDC056227]|uniref:hypothetical protein n=1 Tax=Streptomyces sp. NPDC056227 TaxID=3345753 RepID=UPI0035E0DE5E
MLIKGYDDGPLVAGESLLARPGFWSNYLLVMCNDGACAERSAPEWFGDDGADDDAMSEVLFDPDRPVPRKHEEPVEVDGQEHVVKLGVFISITKSRRDKLTQAQRAALAELGVAMVFKLVESAQARWRAIAGAHLVPLVRAGARFENGALAERQEQAA